MNEKIFPEIPTMPEMPETPELELNEIREPLPPHVKLFLAVYDQQVRAHVVKLEAVIAAHQAEHIRKLEDKA